MNRELLKARLYIFTAGIMWSLGGVFIKSIDLPGTTITFYRAIFAAVICLPFLKNQKLSLDIKKVSAIITYALVVVMFVLATKSTTAANAIILQYTAPAFVMIFALIILKEKIKKNNLLCLIIAMTGIAVIVAGNKGGSDLNGVMLAIASGIAFALYIVIQRYIKDESPVKMVFMYNIGTAVLLIPFVFMNLLIETKDLIMLVSMGIFQLGIPYILFAKGLKIVSAQEGSLIILIEPILNPLWVVFFIGEIPSLFTVIGGSLILTGLIFRFIPGFLKITGAVENNRSNAA